jgi:hypothetical protein
MSFYRLQDADRDAAELLDPAHQWSEPWGGGDPRRGVSVCWSTDRLTDYFQHHARGGIGYDEDFLSTLVLVELDGAPSDEEDEDAHRGAELIIPTRIVSVVPLPADMIAEILVDAPVNA